MALIQWTEDLSVNVEEIDRQHRQLVRMINDLNVAMQEKRAKEVLGSLLIGLLDYANTHFAAEEIYFDTFKYPLADVHKREHKEFVDKVSDFKKRFDSGELVLSVPIIHFLIDWLKKHIMGSDKLYTPYFNARGLT